MKIAVRLLKSVAREIQYFLSLLIPKPTFFSSIEEFFVGESIFPDIMTRDESASLLAHIFY